MTQQDNVPSVVIWDMGGILFQFFTEVLVAEGTANNWPLEEIPLGPTGRIADPQYAAMDRGEINEAEYIKLLVKEFSRHGIEWIPYKIHPPERQETWELIGKFREMGLRQMLLTNDASIWLGNRWWETWPHRHYFEEVVDVKVVGVRKPAPEPYLACIEKLDVRPEECIFIDDMHINCSGAEEVGMQSYWFDITDPKAALKELSERLGM